MVKMMIFFHLDIILTKAVQKLGIILNGLNGENDDFFYLNIILTKAVQNYILKTKRFESIT